MWAVFDVVCSEEDHVLVIQVGVYVLCAAERPYLVLGSSVILKIQVLQVTNVARLQCQ